MVKRKKVKSANKKTTTRRPILVIVSIMVFLLAAVVAIFLAQQKTQLATHASTQTITLPVKEDTFVSASSPTRNYGTDSSLKIDLEKTTFLKFDLTSLANQPITNAKLRLYITNNSSVTQMIKEVSNNNWAENTVTYNTQPAKEITIAQISGTSDATWKEIDITSWVAVHAGTIASLAIDTTGNNNLYTASRETTTQPVIVVQTQTEEVTPTPTIAQATVTPTPTTSNSPTPTVTTPTPTITAGGACPTGQLVTTAAQLTTALTNATPGTVINLASGTYVGPFTVTVSGTEAAPITLCGPANAIIDGNGKSRIFHLNGANWWHVTGFQLKNGNKGLGLTNASHNTVTGLYIHDTSGASAHINTFSSDNLFDQIKLRNAGAEGFYIGSAYGNWCLYSNCLADTSDRNIIQNADIASTDDEPVDIKEGTSNGQVINSHLDGIATAANKGWINVKGNGYLISGNVSVNAQEDGYGVHRVIQGWGNNNTFVNNSGTLNTNSTGYGFYVQSGTTGNVIACGQTIVNAGAGYSNIACQ